jgi:hypothetical protein
MSDYSNTPESIHQPNRILNLERYNGRINVIQPPNQEILFKMTERIAIKNKATDYSNAVSGMLEETMLSRVFFCADNIDMVQKDMRVGVYNMSKHTYMVPPQNIDNIKTIMRSIFIEHAHEGENVTNEVARLNKMVLDYSIPSVYNAAVSHEKFLQDQSTLVVPLELPKNYDRDFKQLEFKQRM